MWMWISIITKDNDQKNSSKMSSTKISPWGTYLYSPSTSFQNSPAPYPESSTSSSVSSGVMSPTIYSNHEDIKLDSLSSSSSTHRLQGFTPTKPHDRLLSPSTHDSANSLLYRPDLIKLSSPRMFIKRREQKRMHKSSNDCSESCGSDGSDIFAVHEDKNNHVRTCVTNEWDNEDYSGNAWTSQMNAEQQGSIYHLHNTTENDPAVRDK